MMSAGCDDPPSDRCGDSSITIDGFEVSPKVCRVFGLTGLPNLFLVQDSIHLSLMKTGELCQ